MAEIPYFLDPSKAPIEATGNIDLFNYDTLQGIKYDGSVKSVWEELADVPGKVGGYVWDATSSSWKAVTDFAGDAVSTVENKLSNFLDAVKSNLLLVLVGGLVVIWIIAKSGILTQLAAFKP